MIDPLQQVFECWEQVAVTKLSDSNKIEDALNIIHHHFPGLDRQDVVKAIFLVTKGRNPKTLVIDLIRKGGEY